MIIHNGLPILFPEIFAILILPSSVSVTS
ncbi:hypothetical protein XAP6984_830083 [Xanthomonas phaseoli pv. phaseoli]|uniref:NADH dehydrogenase subunit 4 n=1 Tax=Xanthomonas campestris pv. phaseoli TaxID=317013 RepID=A0ABY1TXJ1_XANCH|nr:hypothetical protein XAP6984_830083 [Xanthomonas phaseoli pv. phaseoli]